MRENDPALALAKQEARFSAELNAAMSLNLQGAESRDAKRELVDKIVMAQRELDVLLAMPGVNRDDHLLQSQIARLKKLQEKWPED